MFRSKTFYFTPDDRDRACSVVRVCNADLWHKMHFRADCLYRELVRASSLGQFRGPFLTPNEAQPIEQLCFSIFTVPGLRYGNLILLTSWFFFGIWRQTCFLESGARVRGPSFPSFPLEKSACAGEVSLHGKERGGAVSLKATSWPRQLFRARRNIPCPLLSPLWTPQSARGLTEFRRPCQA